MLTPELSEKIRRLREMVNESRNIVFFGGAGVSTESGIPDFRSTDGLYHQQWRYPPEVILSHTFYESNPKEFFRFYRAKLLAEGVQPNAAHRKLAQWEQEGKLRAIVTQNIDGLHQAAGSRRVLELHGSVHRNYCRRCGAFYDFNFMLHSEDVPHCTCGGEIKPDVVLYEEGLDDAVLDASIRLIRQADTLIVAGTSLTVYPAAGLIRFFKGKHLVLINRDGTPMDGLATFIIHDSVGKVLANLTVTPAQGG